MRLACVQSSSGQRALQQWKKQIKGHREGSEEKEEGAVLFGGYTMAVSVEARLDQSARCEQQSEAKRAKLFRSNLGETRCRAEGQLQQHQDRLPGAAGTVCCLPSSHWTDAALDVPTLSTLMRAHFGGWRRIRRPVFQRAHALLL